MKIDLEMTTHQPRTYTTELSLHLVSVCQNARKPIPDMFFRLEHIRSGSTWNI